MKRTPKRFTGVLAFLFVVSVVFGAMPMVNVFSATDVVNEDFSDFTIGSIAGQNSWTITGTSVATSSVAIIAESAAVPATVGHGNTVKLVTATGNSNYGPEKVIPPQTGTTYVKVSFYPTNPFAAIPIRFYDNSATPVQIGAIIFQSISNTLRAQYLDSNLTNQYFTNAAADTMPIMNQWNTVEVKLIHNGTHFTNMAYYLNGRALIVPSNSTSANKANVTNLTSIKIAQAVGGSGTTNYYDDFQVSTVTDPIGTPTGLSWGTGVNSTVANWNAVPNATLYNVYLSKTGATNPIKTIYNVTGNSLDLKSHMTGAGTYWFSVGANSPKYLAGSGSIASSSRNFYSVTYDANGGTGAQTDNNYYISNSNVTVLGVGAMAKAGYTFAGWNTEADGLGSFYLPNDTFTMGTNSVTLYALWAGNPTTINGDDTITLVDGNPVTATYTIPNDTLGNPIPCTWTIDDAPAGISVDNGVVTVTSDAVANSFTLRAIKVGDETMNLTKTITIVSVVVNPPSVTADDIANIIVGFNTDTMEYAISTDGGATYGDYSSETAPALGGSKVVKVRTKAAGANQASSDVILTFTPNFGDVDGDGVINISDVIITAEIAVGYQNCTEEQKIRANVSEKANMTIDISDVVLVIERVAGDLDPFPIDLP